MAPKIKFNEEDVLAAAISIAREKGAEAVNARSIAAKLGCSIQPIFRTYKSMDELKAALYDRAHEMYDDVMFESLESNKGLSAMGLAYVNFAKNEKNLFKMLFMSNAFSQGSIMNLTGNTRGDDAVIARISSHTGLSITKSHELYNGLWFVSHGMASLLATNSCTLSDDEIVTMLKRTYDGLEYAIKREIQPENQ